MAADNTTRTITYNTLMVGVIERYAVKKILDQISVADPALAHWAGRDLEFAKGKIPPSDMFSLSQVKSEPEDGVQLITPTGPFIRVPLRAARNGTTKWIGSYGTLDNTTQNANREAFYSWRTLSGTVSYSEIDVARVNTANEVVPYIQTLLDDLKESVVNNLQASFHGDGSSDGSQQMLGLKAINHITPSTAGFLGGVQRNNAQNAFYRNQALNHDSTTLDRENIEQIILAATRGIYQPTFAITDKVTWRKFWKETLPQERNLRLEGLANLGVRHILLDGAIPLVFSDFATAGRLHLLSKRALKIYINKLLPGKLSEWGTDNKQPQVKTAAWMLDCQMVPWFPRELGVVYNIGTT